MERLQKQLDEAKPRLTPAAQALLPDVEIFVKAVDDALRGGEFYHPRELGWAEEQLELAEERLQQLTRNEHPWTAAHGLVVRGFRSQLDDSVQPYGLVIPRDLDLSQPAPLYVWLHGRGDQTLDVQFIHQRMTSAGQIEPAGAIVLHPFARYCNGYKSAGEVDVFEALEAVCAAYNIDRDRLVLCGFSMGGAGVWHLGAHYPDRWAAMSPGAGFVDVRRYQQLTPDKFPPWYEQTLWGVYDVPDYARNLLNLPLVAYSGEFDKQKAAADIMEAALKDEGVTMTHIIGPGVAHKYEPAALADVLARLKQFEGQGLEHFPASVHFQTRTLRYHRCHWIDVRGLEEHWRDARVDATRQESNRIEITTKNITRLRVNSPWWEAPSSNVTVSIDDQELKVAPAACTEGVLLEKTTAGWQQESRNDAAKAGLAKSPGLQGPLDDALLAPFLVVRPTGRAAHPAVDTWVAEELSRFRERWRTHFRGEVREIDDRDLTDEQIAKYNLIVWGDPRSNSVLARIARELPIAWDQESIRTPERKWPAASHALAMIYPNPLPAGRDRYVVLNSGMTFREAHDRTNSLQNPKLPDWVVFDLSEQPNSESAGRVAAAAFFDEEWQYQAKREIPGSNSMP
ncbi:MAG: prolyl oligopeptidase family serine peptidase [Pirellulales bacterium]|nr:prolyl oligopeptidase family serine peptidase [Pirellulales bacterium]